MSNINKIILNGTEYELSSSRGGGTVSYDLPILYLTGDVTGMSNSVRKQLQYTWVDSANNKQRTGWLDAKWQGDTSLQYPKKNYTFRFYHDPDFSRKDKIKFFDITKQSKWVAKANYIDHSHARNIVSARLWSDIVHSRVTAPPELLTASPNNGAIDGSPIIIYLNGAYLGLYTLNMPKDDFIYGMDEDGPLHCVAYGQYNNNGDTSSTSEGVLSNEFRLASVAGWECEIPGAWTTDTSNGLKALINFVMTSTDADFKTDLNTYLDVESALDYYAFCYFIGASDSLAQNMILATYDGGAKWYCSAYDLDSTFGLYWNGGRFYPYDMECPEDYQDTNNLLWQRIETNFSQELYDRYVELRQSVLSVDYISRAFEQFMGLISDDDYNNDVRKWSGTPQKNVDHLNQIETWIAQRADYVDVQFNEFREQTVCTNVTLSTNSLDFVGVYEESVTITLEPVDTTELITITSSDSTVATVSKAYILPNGSASYTFDVTSVMAGNCTITVACGNIIRNISVTVEDDAVIDYTADPLDGATWLADTTRSKTTGETQSTSGENTIASLITLQKCMYKFDGGQYLGLYVYDSSGNYLYRMEHSEDGASTAPIYFMASPNYKYAIKVFGSTENVSLLPVDNRSTVGDRVSIKLGELSWSTSAGRLFCNSNELDTVLRQLFTVTNNGLDKSKLNKTNMPLYFYKYDTNISFKNSSMAVDPATCAFFISYTTQSNNIEIHVLPSTIQTAIESSDAVLRLN